MPLWPHFCSGSCRRCGLLRNAGLRRAQGVPGPSPHNTEAGSWRRGVRGHHVCPSPSSTPSVPPRPSSQAQAGSQRAGPPADPGLAPAGGLDQSGAGRRGPAPSPGHPGAPRSPASWLLRRPGAKNKLQTTSLPRRRRVVMATGPRGPAEPFPPRPLGRLSGEGDPTSAALQVDGRLRPQAPLRRVWPRPPSARGAPPPRIPPHPQTQESTFLPFCQRCEKSRALGDTYNGCNH